MDPNATLAEIRNLTTLIVNGYADGDDYDELASKVIDLDEWLTKGGFLPKEWER